MSTIAKSFTAVGVGTAIQINHKQSMSYSVSGTFVGTVKLEKSEDGGQTFTPIVSTTTSASGTIVHNSMVSGPAHFRFQCTAFTSGTIVTSVSSVAVVLAEVRGEGEAILSQLKDDGSRTAVRTGVVLNIPAALGKVGGTSGFVPGAADNISLATCPASKTAAKFVIPVLGLKVGSTITGFNLVGQIESGGNTATVDANLRKMTAAAADVDDASVASITQLSVVADTIISASNAGKSSLSQAVAADESYYVLVTVTTGASTDVALQALEVTVTEA